MQYLLLIYQAELPADAPQPSAEELRAEMAAYNAFTAETRERGQFVAGEALEPTTTATSVRVEDGRTVVTDGPFAETKEALGGFYLLECRDLDEAIEMAAKIPAAKRGTIEVRPIWDYAAPGGAG
ncbi:MAG TPA: YciI family protein [Candidatus Limnocylindrales bacterium]|nr:YciI family protein [Candidatus Limnocylindrales bacterium]